MSQPAQRISWIDTAKFLGVFLVMLTHRDTSSEFHQWVYTFHIPIFFFLSGYIFDYTKYKDSFWDFFEKRFKQIIFPYLLLALFGFVIESLIIYLGRGGSYSPAQLLVEVLLGASPTVNLPLWFLPALFTTNMYYYGICKMVDIVITFIGKLFGYKNLTPSYSSPGGHNIHSHQFSLESYHFQNSSDPTQDLAAQSFGQTKNDYLINKKYWLLYILLIICSAFGFYLSKTITSLTVFSWTVSFSAVLIYGIGNIAGRELAATTALLAFIRTIKKTSSLVLGIFLIICIAISALAADVLLKKYGMVNFGGHLLHHYFLYYSAAWAGIFFLICSAVLITSKTHILSHLGRYSMFYFGMHYPIYRLIETLLFNDGIFPLGFTTTPTNFMWAFGFLFLTVSLIFSVASYFSDRKDLQIAK